MFKEILQELMEEADLNQSQLSAKTGIPLTTINGWLNTNRLPDYKSLTALSKFFNVSTDYLTELKGAANEPLVTVSAEATLPKNERELLKIYRSFTDGEKKQLQDFAEYLKSRRK